MPPPPVLMTTAMSSRLASLISSSGVLDRLRRGRDRELAEAAHPARLLEVDVVARVEALHLGRDPDLLVRRVEGGDAAPRR